MNETKQCSKCRMTIPAKATVCPYRRKTITTTRITKLVAVAAALIFLMVLCQVAQHPGTTSSSVAETPKTTKTMSVSVRCGAYSIRMKNTGTPDVAGQTITVY